MGTFIESAAALASVTVGQNNDTLNYTEVNR